MPRDWKLANVDPVHKKGDKEFLENYIPISLLPLVWKALERCVFNNIKVHVFSQMIIPTLIHTREKLCNSAH